MITSSAKSAGWMSTLPATWSSPHTTAASSAYSGHRRRSATTAQSPTTVTVATTSWAVPFGACTSQIPDTPNSRRAQKLSTPVGCLRKKS